MKKFITLIMIMVLALGVVACTPKKPDVDDPGVTPPVEDPLDNEDDALDPTQSEDLAEVNLYFVNDEFIQTGDESLEKLVPEKRTLEVKGTSLEETIVRALMEGTEKEGVRTVIPATAKLLGVEVKDGTAFVNFAYEGLSGGSLEETYTINQIVASLTELDTVDRVQFLLDGEKGDSLMGHYGIEEPFEKPID